MKATINNILSQHALWVLLILFPIQLYSAESACNELSRLHNNLRDQWNTAAGALNYAEELRVIMSDEIEALPENAPNTNRARLAGLAAYKRILTKSNNYQRQLSVTSREFSAFLSQSQRHVMRYSRSDYENCDSQGRFYTQLVDWRRTVIDNQRILETQLISQVASVQSQARAAIIEHNEPWVGTAYSSQFLRRTLRASGSGSSCGNPNEYTTSDLVVDGIGRAINLALGNYTDIPVASFIFQSGDVRNWLSGRLGISDGPYRCSTLCVAYQGRRLETKVTGKNVNNPGSHTVSNPAQLTIGFAAVDDITHTRISEGNVTCANVKHWWTDDDRVFELEVDYEL